MCYESSVGWTILELFKLRPVAEGFLELVDSSFDQTTHSTLQLSNSNVARLSKLKLMFDPIGHGELVGVLKLTILDSDCVDH